MCSNYPGIKLEPALGTWEDKIGHLSSYAHVVHTTAKQVISRRRIKERERRQNVKRRKMHVQSVQNHCFSLTNMQICGVFVAVVVVVVHQISWIPKKEALNAIGSLLH